MRSSSPPPRKVWGYMLLVWLIISHTVCAGNAKVGRFKFNVPGSMIFWVFGFFRLYKDIHQCRTQSFWSARQRIMSGLIWWSSIWNSGFGILKQNRDESREWNFYFYYYNNDNNNNNNYNYNNNNNNIIIIIIMSQYETLECCPHYE